MSKAQTPLDSSHTAVLVVDVQVGLFGGDHPAFDGASVIARINEVTSKARAARVPIIFVQQNGESGGDWMVPGSDAWKLHLQLQIEPSELVIQKTTCDAFYNTRLETELRARKVSTLVLMGFATDFCIDTTLRNAVSKEFEVIVVADAHTTTDGPDLGAQAIRRHFNWAWENCISKTAVCVLLAGELAFSNHE